MRLKSLLLVGIFCLTFSFSNSLMAHEHSLAIENGKLINKENNQILQSDMLTPLPIENSNMKFVAIGENDAKEYDLHMGVYIFSEKNGKLVSTIYTELADFVGSVYFSPNGKIIGLDVGTSPVRGFHLYSFPSGKAMGETSFMAVLDENPGFIWVENKGVLTSSLDFDNNERICNYDPCGPISVRYLDFNTQKTSDLLKGTSLCDYLLESLDGEVVNAKSICLQTINEWKTQNPFSAPKKGISVNLP